MATFTSDTTSDEFAFRIGLRDDPGHQGQRVEALDLTAGALLVTGGSASGRTTVLVNAARQLRQVDPEAQVVLVDCAGGDLAREAGVHGIATWTIIEQYEANLAHLIEQLSVDYIGESPAPVLVAFDRLDLCQDMLGPNLGPLARVIAAGGRRNILIVATADHRLPLEPELAKAFRYRYQFRGDQSHIMSDPEGALIRPYLPVDNRLRIGSQSRSRRPLGFLQAADMLSIVETTQHHAVPIGIDEVRHEIVELAIRPGIPIAGVASSGRTACLFTLCWWVAQRLSHPIPLIAGYDIPECEWLVDVRKLWRDRLATTESELLACILSALRPDIPVVAIDDLDRLDLVIASLGLSSDPTTIFRNSLRDLISNKPIAVLATGPIEILTGKVAVENRLTDALHAVHQNFVVLQPLPEEVTADRGVFALYRRIAARPGRSYGQGEGIAISRRGRHEIYVPIPEAVRLVLEQIPRDESAW